MNVYRSTLVSSLAVLPIALLMLYGCGGGGGGSGVQPDMGGSPPQTPIPEKPFVPTTTIGDPADLPQGRESILQLETLNGFFIQEFEGSRGEGVTAERLVSYLQELNYLPQWPAAPTVRFASDTPLRFRGYMAAAVRQVNEWLPDDLQFRIGEDVEPLTPIHDVPVGNIYVSYERINSWLVDGYVPDSVGIADIDYTPTEIRRAHIWISPQASSVYQQNIATHELLHALGLTGHVSAENHPDSVLDYLASSETHLPGIDGAGLLATYTRIPAGAVSHEISAEVLGPWENEKILIGTSDTANIEFGVSYYNGLVDAWASGDRSSVHLENTTFPDVSSGPATWLGTTIGYTPEGYQTIGDATIQIDLDTLSGHTLFDRLLVDTGEYDPAADCCVLSDIRYDITVNGHTFSGYNEGPLNGAFVGDQHQGAIGVFDHPTLEGSFGAHRTE